MDFGSTMDSSTLAPVEEWADFNFPIFSDLVSSQESPTICSSDDAQHSLLSSIEGSSSAVVEFQIFNEADSAAYMRLAWESSNNDSNSCLHSPSFPESPCSILLSCPPSWLQLQPELEDENHLVPLSSSPPEFTSSSPTSDISSELENEGSSSLTSASSGTRSDSASISYSQHSDCGPRPDPFSQRLHELLLSVQQARELERSRIRDDEADSITCASLSEDSDSFDTDFEHSGNDDQIVVAKIRTATPPSQAVTRSPTVLSKWFSDQGFVDQASKKSMNISSRSSTTLSYVSDRPRSSDKGMQQNSVSNDVSPIRFGIPSHETLRIPKNTDIPRAEAYRIIKRTHSFMQDDKSKDTLMPHTKRHKTQGERGTHTRDRLFASRTASLRRADSLKSVQATDDKKTPTQSGCVATVPATPILAPRKATRKAAASARPLRSPVPIIAPPLDHVPRLPLSAETLAKIRLGKFLEREGRGREKDGLPVSSWEPPLYWKVDSDDEEDEEKFGAQEELIEWEVVLGIGQRAREEVIDWILDVMSSPLPKNSSISSAGSRSPTSCSSASSRNSSSTSSSASTHQQASDLIDQLTNSPETRFHAAWMFLRFFYLTMSPQHNNGRRNKTRDLSRQSSLNSSISASTDQEGRDLVIWDVAVACLALSVKFHRDFLDPLLPVYAREYLSLAPQRLCYEDLETAQRDILSAFDYSLGVSPQPVMDELWFSLGSLRSLLDFENGWQTAMADAWCGLFDAICEPDVQKFSISTLAAVALMDGIVESLVQRYQYEASLKIKTTAAPILNYTSSPSLISRENWRTRRRFADWRPKRRQLAHVSTTAKFLGSTSIRRKYLEKAEQASEGVMSDIQAMVGITDAQLRDCRAWFARLH